MRDSVPSARYSSVCNVLHLWSISLIATYRVSTDSVMQYNRYMQNAGSHLKQTTYVNYKYIRIYNYVHVHSISMQDTKNTINNTISKLN